MSRAAVHPISDLSCDIKDTENRYVVLLEQRCTRAEQLITGSGRWCQPGLSNELMPLYQSGASPVLRKSQHDRPEFVKQRNSRAIP